MKKFTCLLLGLVLSSAVFAQEESARSIVPEFTPGELEKLVAPIALYPDSLVALILPASTSSADVVLAARFLVAGGDAGAVDNEPWSESVRSLAHFPVVVEWMDANLAWTRQMGDVFLAQPADVMSAIQRVRAHAQAAGLLTDTQEQRVVVQGDEICILPAQADIIYVPCYDAEYLWARRSYYRGPFITFGIGFGVGNWLFYDCDWARRTIWIQPRAPGWVYHPGWHRPIGSVTVVSGSPWRPPHHVRPLYRRGEPVVVTTRVHVGERVDRRSHGDVSPHNVRIAPPKSLVRHDKTNPAPAPTVQSVSPYAGRATVSSPPAPASTVTRTLPVAGRHRDRWADENRTPASRSSSSASSPASVSSSDQTTQGRTSRHSSSSSSTVRETSRNSTRGTTVAADDGGDAMKRRGAR